MTAAIEPRAQLPALTGMRGVAAWFVVLFHSRMGIADQIGPGTLHVLSKGYLAVDLFFMLSGFVLWLNYAERLKEHGWAYTPAFLARRLARIWPLHMLMLCGAVAFALLLTLRGSPDAAHYPWSELPLHIILAQNWGFTQGLHWNDPSWSISCEFAAYLCFPLLAFNFRRNGVSTPLLILALIAIASALHLVMRAAGATTLGMDIPHLGLPRAFCEFAMGTILCALWARWRERAQRPLAGSLICLALLSAALMLGAPETLAVPLLFAAMLSAVALTGSSRVNPLGCVPLHYLGEISYATYLVHFLLYIVFKYLFVADPLHVPSAMLALFLLLVLGASVALHHMVERPAQRMLNRAFDAWQPRMLARS